MCAIRGKSLKITGLDIRYQEPHIVKNFRMFNTFCNAQLFLVFIINSFTENVLKIYSLLKTAQDPGFSFCVEELTI